jgi:hypothetical protein
MVENSKGPGVLKVQSKIVKKDMLDQETYMKWYDEDHIPEILATSGVNSAWRFINNDPDAEEPFLAFYPVDDLAFLQSDEFKGITVDSKLLPENTVIYDLADFNVRYDALTQVYDPTNKGKGESSAALLQFMGLVADFLCSPLLKDIPRL